MFLGTGPALESPRLAVSCRPRAVLHWPGAAERCQCHTRGHLARRICSFSISLPTPGHDFQANALPSSRITPHCTSCRVTAASLPSPPDTRGLKPSSGTAESRSTGLQPESPARSRGLKQRAARHLRARQIRRLSAWMAFSRCHARAVRSGQDGGSAAAPPAGRGRDRAG